MISIDKSKCTGCGACIQKCPNDCISMECDEYGFEYPKIDVQQCINCNACEKVCQQYTVKNMTKSVQRAYAAVNESAIDLYLESSGGAFGAIAKKILEKSGIVYGCAIMNGIDVKHIRVTSLENLKLLYGSKYVYSTTGDTFSKVKDDLEKGKIVLYSGTPCQISGLKLFLQKNYDNLYTVDIVCHGVPSQYHFKKMLDWIGTKHNIKIVDVLFRTKDKKKAKGTYSGAIVSDDGKHIKYAYYDYYYYFYYLMGLISRENCYQCQFANLNRPGDITIGDFWGVEGFKLDLDISRGCSLVITNSVKGNELLQESGINKQEVPLDAAIKNNKQLSSPVDKPEARMKILNKMKILTTGQLQTDFLKSYKRQRLLCRLKYLIPSSVKTVIQRIRYRNVLKG